MTDADTIREALDYSKQVWDNTDDDRYYNAALAALDRLEAEMLDKNRLAVEAQTQRDEASNALKLLHQEWQHEGDRAVAAEQERDEAKREWWAWNQKAGEMADQRNAAEARVAALEEALRFYADPASWEESSEPDPRHFATGIIAVNDDEGEIARAALAKEPS